MPYLSFIVAPDRRAHDDLHVGLTPRRSPLQVRRFTAARRLFDSLHQLAVGLRILDLGRRLPDRAESRIVMNRPMIAEDHDVDAVAEWFAACETDECTGPATELQRQTHLAQRDRADGVNALER